jgi:Uma2 family endonuclease
MTAELKPRKISVAEYRRMAEVGILDSDERVELLDGVIVEMSPIGMPHWRLHGRIVEYLVRRLGSRGFVAGQASVALGEFNEPQPDILIVPPEQERLDAPEPRPDEIWAVVEIADSSLLKDTGPKRALYERFEIRDYLVADVGGARLLRYAPRSSGSYGEPAVLGHGDRFRLAAIPDVELEAGAFLPPP